MIQRSVFLLIACVCISLGLSAQSPFWLKNANGPGNDEIYDIVKYQSDYYVTGYYSNNTTFDNLTLYAQQGGEAFVGKVNENGNFLWVKRIGGVHTDKGIAISVMPNGNIVATGHFVGNISIDNLALSSSALSQDIFVACFSPTGTTLWAKKIGGLGIDIVSDVQCDLQNNIVVTGQFIGKLVLGVDSLESGINPLNSAYSYDIFITKMNSQGDYLWSKHTLTKKNDRSGKIAVGSDNSIFVSGNFTDTLTLGNVYNNNSLNMGFIVHYNQDGEHLWFRRVQSSVTEIMDIACTDSLLYLTGSYSGIQRFANDETTSSWQNLPLISYPKKYYVAAYNYGGTYQFGLSEGSHSNVTPKAISPKPSGGFYLTGEFECQHTGYQQAYGSGLFISRGYKDLFISEYSSSNTRLWAKQIGSTGMDEVFAMVINSYGNPVFAGSFSNSLASPAKVSWGDKPWYNRFTTNYGSDPEYVGEPLMNYCGDPQYNFYAVIQSQGSRDMLIANIADTTRSTLDIFRRSPGDCVLEPTYGSVESFATEPCVNLKARPVFSTANASISGINYTYNWNGQNSSSSIYSPTVSGNVFLTASGANTCYSFTDSVFINLYPIIPTPEVSITGGNFVNISSPQNSCPRSLTVNPDSTIILTGNTPSPAFTYAWHLPGSTIVSSNVLTINNTLLGYYTYVITDPLSGCSKTFCFTLRQQDTISGGGGGGGVTLDLKFRLGNTVLEEGDTLFGCLGDELTLTLVNAIDTYNVVDAYIPLYGSWSNYPYNASIVDGNVGTLNTHSKTFTLLSDSLENGILHIGISFHNGNSQFPAYLFSTTYYVHLYPQPTFPYTLTGDFASICPGDTAHYMLDTDLDYSFNLDLGQNVVTSEDPLTFYTVFPQSYHIVFTNTTNMGCTGTKAVDFSMSYIDAPPILANPSDAIVCEDEFVDLSVPGATAVTWVGPSGDTLSTNLVHTTNTIGYYYSLVVDSNGCDQITSAINVRDRSSFGYELFPERICPGETATISLFALQGDSIRWLPPFSGNSLIQTATAPGLYRFTAPFCGIIDTFDVIVPGPLFVAEIESIEDSLLCPGDTITLSSVNYMNVDLVWFNDYSGGPTLDVGEGGTYILQLIDENACATYDSLTIVLLPETEAPGLPGPASYCGLEPIQLYGAPGDTLAWFLGNQQVAYSPDFIYYPEFFDSLLYIANYNPLTGCNSSLIEYPVDARRHLEVPLQDSLFTLCQGDTFEISVSPINFDAVHYQLIVPLQGATTITTDSIYINNQVTPGNSGVYMLIFEGDSTKYCRPDTIRYTLNVLPVPQLSIIASDPFLCSEDTVLYYVNTDPAIVERFWSYSSFQLYQDTLTIYNSSLSGNQLIINYHAIVDNGCVIQLADTFLRGTRPPQPYFLDSLEACSGDQVDLVLPDNQTAYWFIGAMQMTQSQTNSFLFNSYVNHPPITVKKWDTNGVCPTEATDIPVYVRPRVNIPDINNAALCPGVPRVFYFNPGLYNVGTYYWKDMIADTILAINQSQLTLPPVAATIGLFAFPSSTGNGCGSDSTIFNITVQTLPELTVTSLQNDTICLNNGIAYSASTSNVVSSLGAYLNGSTNVASVCSNCSTHDFLLANSVVPGLQLGQNTIRTRVYTYSACVIERTDTFEVITQADPNFAMDDLRVCVGDTIQIQFPGTGIYDWIESNTFNYLTYPYYGIAIPFDVYASAASSIDYLVEDGSPSLYITSVDPETQCRSGFYQVPISIKPSIDLPPFSSYSICAYDSISFGFSPSDELIGNYQWTLPDGSLSQDTAFHILGTNLPAMGEYQVIAYASALSCGIDSASFTLESFEVPTVALTTDSFHVCTGMPLILHASLTGETQFEWNYNGTSSQDNPLILNLPDFSSDSLLIQGSVSNSHGCVVTDDLMIAVYPTPEMPDLTVPSTICAQDTILLTLNNILLTNQQFTYSSNVLFGQNGNQLIYIPGLQDTVISISSAITTEHCASDTLTNVLRIHQLPAFNLGNDSLLFCFGVGMQLDGPPGYSSYSWSTGSTEQSIEIFETGTYALLLADEHGCLFNDTIFVVGDWPIFDISTDTIHFCYGDPVELVGPEGFDNYAWNTGVLNANLKVTQTGLYTLTITDANGCQFSDSIYVQGGDCEVQNQPNVFTPNGDDFNDKFKLKPYGAMSYSMVIHDRWGKHIKNVSEADDGWDGRDTFGKEMPEGVYYFVAQVNYLNSSAEEIRGMIQLLK